MAEVITIRGQYAQLDDPSDSFRKEVRKITSYYVAGFRFTKLYQARKWDGKKKLLSSRNIFPSGFVPMIIEKTQKEFEIIVNDETVNFDPVPFNHSLLRQINLYRQGKGGKVFDYEAKAVQSILENERGIIQIATNGGKTEIAIAAAKMIHESTGKNILFVTHRKNLARQTKKRFEKEFDRVGFIGEGKWEPEKGVTICIVDTITAKGNKELAEKLLKVFLKDGAIILDECHHTPADTWYGLAMACKARFRIGLSGTPLMRGDGANICLIGATGPVIASVKNRQLIDWGFSVEPICIYSRCNYPNLEGIPFRQAYTLGIVKNANRNSMIAAWAHKFVKASLQVLILFWEVEHGAKIYKAITERTKRPVELIVGGLNKTQKVTYKDIPFGYSADERERAMDRFQKGEANILIASSILDEGMDISNIDALILAAGQKSSIRTLQRIGRAVRKSLSGLDFVFVVDIVDFQNKTLTKHSLQRFKDCKKEKFQQCEFTPEGFAVSEFIDDRQGKLF